MQFSKTFLLIYLSSSLLIYLILISLERMSRYRGSPSRSPYRSPPRLYETERDAIIQEDIRLKNALRNQSDLRRMNDQIAMLQIKVRHTKEYEDKIESLIRQNNQLARDNDELARELSERRYENQRLKVISAEQHDREALRAGQLFETNKSLELEIDLLKKERAEANRSFQEHITHLERILDQKVVELDTITLKYNDLSKEFELAGIRFEQQKNHLKNVMTRTQHQLERQLTYTKQKQTNQKFSQIQTLKRNHTAQIILLQDQIAKLKNLNTIKSQEFQNQLNENKNLRKKHDEEVRLLGVQNDELRTRMFKLEQMNRSQVKNIELKYTDYHAQGTNSLKQQHSREIKLLLDEIDKQKWLINEKNVEIQNLVHDKREQKRYIDELQLQLNSQIDSLKNKLYAQQEKSAQTTHNLMNRVNELTNSLLKDSQSYHQRCKEFKGIISNLEAQINDKQNIIDRNRKSFDIKEKEFKNEINNLNFNLEKTKRQLNDRQYQLKQVQTELKDYQQKSEEIVKKISEQLNKTQVKLQEAENKIASQGEDFVGTNQILKIQVDSLKNTISVLEKKLSDEQSTHAKQMEEFSSNVNDKLKRLQASQRKALDQLQLSKTQQIETLNGRIQKLTRDKNFAESDLKRYIKMYGDLQKYFKEPHDGALFDQKSKNSIYEVLQGVERSSIHIF